MRFGLSRREAEPDRPQRAQDRLPGVHVGADDAEGAGCDGGCRSTIRHGAGPRRFRYGLVLVDERACRHSGRTAPRGRWTLERIADFASPDVFLPASGRLVTAGLPSATSLALSEPSLSGVCARRTEGMS